MTHRIKIVLAGIFMLCSTQLLAQTSQEAQSSNSTQPLWEIHLDLAQAYASPLGALVMKKILAEEPETADRIDDFIEAIGFDPRTDVHEVTIHGNSFEPNDVTIVANLGETVGNLEGWILAAPGYRVEDLDDDTLLHSFEVETRKRSSDAFGLAGPDASGLAGPKESKPKPDRRIWCALPSAKGDNHHVLVASFDQQTVVKLAKAIRSGESAPPASENQSDSILAIAVRDLSSAPLKIDASRPGAGVLQIVNSFVVNVVSGSDELIATVQLSADSPAKAGQLNQLINGLRGMVQFAAGMEDNDEAKVLAALIEPLTVSYREGDTQLEVSLATKYSDIEKLIDN